MVGAHVALDQHLHGAVGQLQQLQHRGERAHGVDRVGRAARRRWRSFARPAGSACRCASPLPAPRSISRGRRRAARSCRGRRRCREVAEPERIPAPQPRFFAALFRSCQSHCSKQETRQTRVLRTSFPPHKPPDTPSFGDLRQSLGKRSGLPYGVATGPPTWQPTEPPSRWLPPIRPQPRFPTNSERDSAGPASKKRSPASGAGAELLMPIGVDAQRPGVALHHLGADDDLLHPAQAGSSNMVSSRMPSMMERSPRAPVFRSIAFLAMVRMASSAKVSWTSSISNSR